MRLIDADALMAELREGFTEEEDGNKWLADEWWWAATVRREINEAPTICCETCKHGIKGECIDGCEYFGCIKPYAGLNNYHTKDWVCGDWKGKDAID